MLRVCVIGLGPIGNRHATMYKGDALAELVQAPDWRRPDYANWIEQARALAP